MIRNYMLLTTTLLMLGCSDTVKVSPNKLPDAYLNQPYQANIEITGVQLVI